jgi:hypothetical protein
MHEPIVKNARRCSICGCGADRYEHYFLCTNPDCKAMGDLTMGIFTKLSFPEERDK